MLEVLAIIWLSNKNKANALARGRKPGGFVALTIALWFGLEIIGITIGFAAEMGIGAYVLGLVLAIVGGLVSYMVANNCRPGEYVSPAARALDNVVYNSQPLEAPARIDIIRESSMVGAVVSWSFTLNGQQIGSLGNGKAMTAYTKTGYNVLVARDAYGTEIAPFIFGAQSGGYTELHFKTNRFLPEHSTGIIPPATIQAAASSPGITPCFEPMKSNTFCTNCGALIATGMAFCTQCGSPQAATPQRCTETAGAVPAEVTNGPLDNRPNRTVWAALIIFGAWLLMLLLQAAMGKGTIFNSSAMYIITDVLFGTGIFLIIQHGIKYKLIAAFILLTEAIMVTFNQTAVVVTSRFMGGMDDFFKAYTIWPGLGFALLTAAIASGLALLFSFIWRNRQGAGRTYAIGWIAAGGTALYGIVRMLIYYLPYISSGAMMMANFITIIIGYLVDAAVIGLSVMTLAGLSRQRKERLRLSVWAIVWCSLSIVGMLASLLFSIIARYPTPVLLIPLLAVLTGYIMLLCKNRTGFFVVLIGVSVYLVATFETSLQQVLYGGSQYAVQLLGTVAGAANPIITWFSIRGAWKSEGREAFTCEAIFETSFQQPRPIKAVKTFSKVAAIVVLVIGAGASILPFPFIISDGFVIGMLPFLLIGALVVTFSIMAVVSLFGKNSVYRKWLDILMRVLFWIICAVIAGTLITVGINSLM